MVSNPQSKIYFRSKVFWQVLLTPELLEVDMSVGFAVVAAGPCCLLFNVSTLELHTNTSVVGIFLFSFHIQCRRVTEAALSAPCQRVSWVRAGVTGELCCFTTVAEELGEGWWGGAYWFSSDFRSTPVNTPLQCQLARGAQENLSVFLFSSIVGWWYLFILPRNSLMNLCPSVRIQ